MRRSRLSFACLFIVIAGILWLSYSTIRETYDRAKLNWAAQKGDNKLFHKPDDGVMSNPNSIIPPAEVPIAAEVPLNLNFPPQAPPSPPDASTSTLESSSAFDDTKYPFQDDLSLPLPAVDLKTLADKWPHNYDPAMPVGSKFAYATFMNTHNPSIRDPYFMAVQSLINRVLWRSSSKTHSYPFITFVASYVTQEQRQLLAGAGAIVRELGPLDWNPSRKDLADGEDKPIYSRWKDTFSKLHMWAQTDFDRILFLDADAFPLEKIDEMFDLVAPKACNALKQEPSDLFPDGSASCNGEEFIFSGVPQLPGIPVEINVGAMVFTPSQPIYNRFLQNYQKYNMYNTNMADQAFFAWQFRQDGAFPVTPLERQWGGFFPHEEDKGKLKVVHEKLWAAQGWLLEEWLDGWREMLEWYEGSGFEGERNKDEFFKPKLGKHLGNGEML
ncbi:hypothetical protein BPOR_0392g00070 [Botrytis porri]|uniref:Glycosyltransferase family 8 protein n=1 Tax=Botrytis porri TaxID=87229 RepID=A0A4Z1KME0_9HELO|nr:hypothetical protein BPOR_0392g00070 [Botrytis porri]